MNQDETAPISIVAMRADAYSPDGKNVIISLTMNENILCHLNVSMTSLSTCND